MMRETTADENAALTRVCNEYGAQELGVLREVLDSEGHLVSERELAARITRLDVEGTVRDEVDESIVAMALEGAQT